MNQADNIAGYLEQFYRLSEYPALIRQVEEFRNSGVFRNRRLFDATPVFRNTLAKYLPLIAGGAQLAVGINSRVPHDPEIVRLLKSWDIEVIEGIPDAERNFDIVMDCAGVYTGVKSNCGYVELTRSGLYHYRDSSSPVFFADGGRIKLIETALGTGDGFVRAMQKSGFGDFDGRKIVIFGCGKVGRGIAVCASAKGADVIAVDNQDVIPPVNVKIVDMNSPDSIDRALENAWCVVSVTGKADAWKGRFNIAKLLDSSSLIVNMGVEDEFGPEVPEQRVMNNKKPLNFLLDEPTRMRYIEATMALDNSGAAWLLQNTGHKGIIMPPEDMENGILAISAQYGEIRDELKAMELM